MSSLSNKQSFLMKFNDNNNKFCSATTKLNKSVMFYIQGLRLTLFLLNYRNANYFFAKYKSTSYNYLFSVNLYIFYA